MTNGPCVWLSAWPCEARRSAVPSACHRKPVPVLHGDMTHVAEPRLPPRRLAQLQIQLVVLETTGVGMGDADRHRLRRFVGVQHNRSRKRDEYYKMFDISYQMI